MTGRILIVGNFLSGHGFARGVCEDLSERLRIAGHFVVTSSSKRIRMLRLADMLSTVVLRRDEYQVAIVDVYSGLAFVWAELVSVLLRILGKPFILELHGGNLPQFSKSWPKRVRRLLRNSAAVVAPSEYLARQLSEFRGDIKIIPNPIDINLYHSRAQGAAAPKVIWLRAFHRIYSPTQAPKLIGRLSSEFPDIQLTMIGPDKGDGSYQEAVNLSERLRLNGRIRFVGRVDKESVSEWLSTADIFLNTTLIDNTPVTVIEAMACGLCIVSTNVGGIPYLLKDGETALLVPPNDEEAMASAIRRLLTDESLALRLSSSARRAAKRFDWSVVLPEWESVIESVASDYDNSRKASGAGHS